jgi:glutamate N-acetyltransferase/amino-acid N-acetyltransferase
MLPQGFRASGAAAGVKPSGDPDIALFVSDVPAVAAGVLTRNKVTAAPVKLCRERLAAGSARAIVMNSGNANACTGSDGLRHAEQMAACAAQHLHVAEEEVLVCSTGTIGKPLPIEKVELGIEKAVQGCTRDGLAAAARAMMTTDTGPKQSAQEIEVDGKPVLITGVAKGAGMIQPNMATMLAFILTDVVVERSALQSALADAVDHSFNRITVDGDMSTNDTVLALANGAAGNAPLRPGHESWPAFTEALNAVAHDLAMQIVRDGEGATRVVTIEVTGAVDDAEADKAARAVANSLLVKTSWAGTSISWGRVMDAIGYSGVDVSEDRVDIAYDGVPAANAGVAVNGSAEALADVVAKDAFTLTVDLHLGKGRALVYTCNCTEEYVRINM